MSISIMACSATEMALAPPLLETGTLARRAASRSNIVVAGAEQLVQTEAGRGTIEGVAGAHIGVADEIFGDCERGFELGVLVAHDDELEPGWCERAGKLGDLGEGGRDDNDAGKGHGGG